MTHAYRLATLKLVSDIELPELLPWEGQPDAPGELRFRLGKVPRDLDTPGSTNGVIAASLCDRYLFDEDDRILIEHGSEVTIEPALGTDLVDLRASLMAPVQAVLWHQRGLLPLHASVVETGGRAGALAGPSGAGKSTLAATLALKGNRVLADDICIVDVAAGAEVLSGTPRLRLWRDAIEHFGIPADGLPRALSRREKYLIEAGPAGLPARCPLAAIVLLARQPGDCLALERLSGARSIVELHGIVHMMPAAAALGLQDAVFRALTGLPRCGVSVWQLTMPEDYGQLDEAAAMVLRVLDG